jgi:hypothetical protein
MAQVLHMSACEHDLTVHGSFTQGVYRDVYPAINPSQPTLSQKGKVVLITGASRGIGKDVSVQPLSCTLLNRLESSPCHEEPQLKLDSVAYI